MRFDTLQPNESGLRFQHLLQERWNTTATFSPSSNQETFGLRGFHGTYTVNVGIMFDVENLKVFRSDNN